MICHFVKNVLILPILPGFLHNSSLATTNYRLIKSTQAWWQNSIYHQESTSSLDHCASICEISYIDSYMCDIFSFDGSTCHVGNNDKISHTHNVPAGVSVLYSDPGNFYLTIWLSCLTNRNLALHCRPSSRGIGSLPDSRGGEHDLVSQAHWHLKSLNPRVNYCGVSFQVL